MKSGLITKAGSPLLFEVELERRTADNSDRLVLLLVCWYECVDISLQVHVDSQPRTVC